MNIYINRAEKRLVEYIIEKIVLGHENGLDEYDYDGIEIDTLKNFLERLNKK